MKYHQRDIVEVNFLFPDGTYKPHPAIIVSNDELQEDEDGLLYLVLISSNDKINPQYSYPLRDEMLIGHTFAKPSLVKCQIIAGYVERDTAKIKKKLQTLGLHLGMDLMHMSDEDFTALIATIPQVNYTKQYNITNINIYDYERFFS
jgi:hypothetical protein